VAGPGVRPIDWQDRHLALTSRLTGPSAVSRARRAAPHAPRTDLGGHRAAARRLARGARGVAGLSHVPGAALERAAELAAAEAGYRDALRLATALELRPLAARCHRGLGQVHRRTDETAAARELLTSAIVAFREMGMRTALAQTEDELKAIA